MSHDHSHGVTNFDRIFAVSIILNLLFVVIEGIYGVFSNSLALIADSGHNLSDVFTLLLAWGAYYLSKKPVTNKRTYGYKKVTILASLISSIVLLIALGAITWESIQRLLNPKPVANTTVIVVATIGIIINTITALLFMKDQKNDLNIRGAFLHMAADAGVSLGVVIAGVVIKYTNWLLIDPLVSLAIVAVILVGTWSLLKESVNLAIDAVPESIDIGKVKKYLESVENVQQIHDMHVWALSTTEVALSVHIIVSDYPPPDNLTTLIQQELHDHYKIEHATIQVENVNNHSCMLDN